MNPRIVRRWESFEAKREGEGERRKRKKKKKNTLRNCGATNCALKNEGEWGKTRGMIKAAISPLINFNRSAHGRPWWLIKFSGKTTFTSVPEPRYCAAYSWKIYVANATEFVVTGFRKYFRLLIARPPTPTVLSWSPFNSMSNGKYVYGKIYLGTGENECGKCILSGVKWFWTLYRKFVISFRGRVCRLAII